MLNLCPIKKCLYLKQVPLDMMLGLPMEFATVYFEYMSCFNCINSENRPLKKGQSYTIVCQKGGGEYCKPKTNSQIKCSKSIFSTFQ